VRNSEYVIRIIAKNGRTWTYLKEGDVWKQTGPTGRVHRLTAEQLLSHILPPLVGDQPGISVMITRRRGRVKKGRSPVRAGLKSLNLS
jgi:hypothetical protein